MSDVYTKIADQVARHVARGATYSQAVAMALRDSGAYVTDDGVAHVSPYKRFWLRPETALLHQHHAR